MFWASFIQHRAVLQPLEGRQSVEPKVCQETLQNSQLGDHFTLGCYYIQLQLKSIHCVIQASIRYQKVEPLFE